MNWTVVSVCLMSSGVTAVGVYRSCTVHKKNLPGVLVVDAVAALSYALVAGLLYGMVP